MPDGKTKTQSVKYEYDYLNRRTEKAIETEDETGKKQKTGEKYTYTAHDIALQSDLDGDLTNRYFHGTPPSHEQVIDFCLADENIFDYNEPEETTNVLHLLSDNLSSITAIADYDPTLATTEIVATFTYSAYGAITSQTGTATTIYGYTSQETDRESNLNYYDARYYDVYLGAFTSIDPIGFESNDVNLYRYVGNNPTNATDPTGLERLVVPASYRGTWVGGTRGDGVFVYNGCAKNVETGLVGTKVVFKGGYIAEGGFPAEQYWGGNSEKTRVTIKEVLGTKADFDLANAEMRQRLGPGNWEGTPDGYTWNHTGQKGSKTLELVKRPFHERVHHKGPAAAPRAAARIATKPTTTAKSTAGRIGRGGVGGLNCYASIREVLVFADVLPEYQEIKAPYYFSDRFGSVFVVEDCIFTKDRKIFIAGPRAGETEYISTGDLAFYKHYGEYKNGRYIPGTIFNWFEPRFIPGTDKNTLPIEQTDPWGIPQRKGYIDEDGIHWYPEWDPRSRIWI